MITKFIFLIGFLISSLYIDFLDASTFISLYYSVQLKDFKHILQFGMLIEYLFEKFPNFEDVNESAIGDLQVSEKYYLGILKFNLYRADQI